MNKKEAYKIVFEDLKKHPLFMGKYDAKNGNPHFMYGMATVMEFIANNISEETYDDFCDTWTKNMNKSEEIAEYEKRNAPRAFLSRHRRKRKEKIKNFVEILKKLLTNISMSDILTL